MVVIMVKRGLKMTKKCRTCNRILDEEKFNKAGKYRDGKIRRRPDCKDCMKKTRSNDKTNNVKSNDNVKSNESKSDMVDTLNRDLLIKILLNKDNRVKTIVNLDTELRQRINKFSKSNDIKYMSDTVNYIITHFFNEERKEE